MEKTDYDSTVKAERQIAIGLAIIVLVSIFFSVNRKKVFKYG